MKKSTSEYFELREVVLGELKNDEIKNILKENLGIVNDVYLQRITKVAKGNIRLAMLAGMKSVKDGLIAIRNAEDIFSNYYKSVFEKTSLRKKDLLMIFLATFFGPIRYKENEEYLHWIEKFEIERESVEIIERLYSLELLDWFLKEKLLKFQIKVLEIIFCTMCFMRSTGFNCLLLLKEFFRHTKNKLIYALNTLISLFDSTELMKYIQDEVNNVWKDIDESLRGEFIECFYQLNLEKALLYLKDYIDKEQFVTFDLETFDFSKEKNYSRISVREIRILAGFKNTEYFKDALELLLVLYEKRPDYIMDIYLAITEANAL